MNPNAFMDLYELYSFSYGFVLLFYGTSVLVLGFNVWRRKNIQPLKFREPKLMLISLIGSGITLGMICFRELDPDQFSCSLYVWISCMFPPTFFAPYALRCLRLKFIYHWLQSGPLTHSASKSDPSGINDYEWYTARRKWVASGSLLIIFLVIFAIHIVLAYTIDMSLQISIENRIPFKEIGGVGCIFDNEFVPFFVISLMYIILFALCLASLNDAQDHYGSKKEFYLCSAVWVLCLIPFFVGNLFPEFYWTDEVFANANWIIVMIILSTIISIVHPLCMTYYPSVNQSLHNRPAYVTSTSIIVGDPHLRNIFSEYIVGCLETRYVHEFSFLVRISEYKEECGRFIGDRHDQMKAKYLFICKSYLEDYSLYELKDIKTSHPGLSSEVIGCYDVTQLGSLGSVFDKVASACVKDLDERVLKGFLVSDGYAKYAMAINRSVGAAAAMVGQNLV